MLSTRCETRPLTIAKQSFSDCGASCGVLFGPSESLTIREGEERKKERKKEKRKKDNKPFDSVIEGFSVLVVAADKLVLVDAAGEAEDVGADGGAIGGRVDDLQHRFQRLVPVAFFVPTEKYMNLL